MKTIAKLDDLVILLLNFFEHPLLKNRRFTLKEIKKYFFSNYMIHLDDLKEALNYLEKYGFIYKYKDNHYGLLDNDQELIQGNIKINKYGFAVIQKENKFYKVNRENLNGALDGDNVVVRLLEDKDNIMMGKVEKIVERKDGLLIVEIFEEDNKRKLKACNAIFDYPIVINPLAIKYFVNGDRILVKVDKTRNNQTYYAGLVKYIGHKDGPSEDLKLIASEYNIPIEFSSAALEEAHQLPVDVCDDELIGRLDLTNELVFSIDNANTKDRDDAISLMKDEVGNFILGVHIADVSHYVKPNSALWQEAKKRSTSVYMANSVIPMFPYKLLNGICSLNPGVLRLTFSCIITVSPRGDILNFQFKESYIKSRKALTYGMVNDVINEGVVNNDMVEFAEVLLQMKKLSNILNKKRRNKGYVEFGCNDVNIVMDDNGEPLDFIPRKKSDAEKIIENFMLLAGECAAFYVKRDVPYRVHDVPNCDQINHAFETLKKSGVKVKLTEDITNIKAIQNILLQIKNMDEKELATNIILRSMPKARYASKNVGHFGLSLEKYCHFTSPIRRFPDLLLHSILKSQLYKSKHFVMTSYELHKACEYATKKEYLAVEAEQSALRYVMIQYINEHIGERFNAIVTYVNSSGIFIKTTNGIEGMLDPLDIEDDNFIYNSKFRAYIGKNTKIKITLGTQLDLVALDTKREYKTINFGLNSEDLMQLSRD